MRIQQIDADTGEVLDATIVLCFNRKKIGGRFCMLFQDDAWDTLLQDRELTFSALRVLMFMIRRMDFENYLQIRQVVISEKLGIAQPNVSTAIKLLVNKGVVEIVNREGYRYYHLNADYVWKGRAKTLQHHREQRGQQAELGRRKLELSEGGLSA